MSSAAMIVAAGRGVRALSSPGGQSAPKQYRILAGRTVLQWSLEAFLSHPEIATLVVVIHPDDRALYDQSVASLFERIPLSGGILLPPVIGGESRQQSVFAGLEKLRELENPPSCVLIHDAARPMIEAKLIDRLLAALGEHRAVLPALKISDTLKRAENNLITETVDRQNLWAAQTPQAFSMKEIYQAHLAARAENEQVFTDDASIAEWHGLAVCLVAGECDNIKLTKNEDFQWAERILKGRQMTEKGLVTVGNGFDVHRFEPGDHLILCGVKIPYEQRLKGHSDADVGLHALTDAILGALGEADIGAHFPPTDSQWAGASSDLFLRDAQRRVFARGGHIRHVDVTLICEAPKIGPHRTAMCARIAEILNLERAHVSVKATTSEGLGFTGRGEGIAAMATATLWCPDV